MESTLTPKAAKFLNSQILFRDACEADIAFIFNSWLKSNRTSSNTNGVSNPVYFAQHHILIEGICKSAYIKMVVNAQDQSQIYGYIAHQEIEGTQVVHYCYVKEPYRKLGLAKLLLEQIGVDFDKPFFTTHRTNIVKTIEKRHPIVYNPYLAYSAYAIGRQLRTEALEQKWAPDPERAAEITTDLKQQVANAKAALGLE